jgi:hypothetical protein
LFVATGDAKEELLLTGEAELIDFLLVDEDRGSLRGEEVEDVGTAIGCSLFAPSVSEATEICWDISKLSA